MAKKKLKTGGGKCPSLDKKPLEISGFWCPHCGSDEPASVRNGLWTCAVCGGQHYSTSRVVEINGRVVQTNETIKFPQRPIKLWPRKKLRTMNEVSAAEAVDLFYRAHRALWHWPGGSFPLDVVAKDFFEWLEFYRRIAAEYDQTEDYEDQRAELANIVAGIPEKDLEEFLKEFTPKEREILEVIQKEPRLQVKEIAAKLDGKPIGTIKTHLSSIYRKMGVPNRGAAIAKIKAFPSAAPPKA